jgi:hypothetical protein
MKEKIFKIIQGPLESEPIYQLESEYKSLSNDVQKKEFLSIIKSLALNGTIKEKFMSLTIIEFLDKAKECEDIIKSNTEAIVFKENENLISPLLTLCAALSTNWAIGFIQKVIKHFTPKSNEYSYYFDIGIRSIVSTLRWIEVIDEIIWALGNYDEDYIIDFIAYFKWKRGDYELEKLFQLVSGDNFRIEKIDNLEIKINNRYTNNYRKLSQSK